MERRPYIYTRSREGIHNKFLESLKIIEYSIMMVEFFEIKEFNSVIATQLRILLNDTLWKKDNSLLKKVNNNPKLYPVKSEFTPLDIDNETGFIFGDLFDYSREMIPLEQWLDQIIYKIEIQGILHKISIKDFIKLTANKSGGAHVDTSLVEKALIVDLHAETVLCRIAKGVLKSLGRDFEQNNPQNFSYLINTLTNKIEHS